MSSISQTPSVYQIRHIASGKVYIGSAVNPRKRWTSHLCALRAGTHHSRYLQRAWDKYGEPAFVFEIIEPVLFTEDLLVREQYWLDKLRAADRKRGFNVCPVAGSSLGVKQTDEQRAITSERTKARLADPEERARMSERAKVRLADPTTRAKMSASAKARAADPVEREKMIAREKARAADPSLRAAISARQKAYWADPTVRARMSEQAKARMSNPEERARLSEQAKARWRNPLYRANRAKGNKGE